MTDRVSLAGTIGTWVAVFLGVVALAGILPAYIVIQKSRQDQNQALAAVDDPGARFVSKGFNAPWLRGFRNVKVPDLQEPPRFTFSQPQQMKKPPPKLDPNVPDIRRSSTGWINFANIIAATLTELTYAKDSGYLKYGNGQSYFPIHCGWLLIVTIMHRYAYREDFGLPIGSFMDVDLEVLNPKRTLSGLSGVLLPSPKDNNSVLFKAHNFIDVRINLVREPISLSSLCFLFGGLLPGVEGKLWNVRSSRGFSTPPAHKVEGEPTILDFAETRDRTSVQLRLIRLLGLTATNARTLRAKPASSALAAELANGAGLRLTTEYVCVEMREYGDDCWLFRRDLHHVLLIYLQSAMSPRGCLYDWRADEILQHVVSPYSTEAILKLAQNAAKAINIKDTQRTELRSMLEQAATDNLGQGWSRTEMAMLCRLDQSLATILGLNDLKSLAISILFMYETSFQAGVVKAMTNDVQVPARHVLIDFEQRMIRLPDLDRNTGYQDISFDFMAALSKVYDAEFATLTNHGTIKELRVPLTDCVFACVRANIRVLMWKMSLDPKDLISFFSKIANRKVIYIESQTETIIDDIYLS